MKIHDIKIASGKHKADPFPIYQQFRESCPVPQIRLANRKTAWLITRYDDAKAAFQNKLLIKNRFSLTGSGQTARWVPGLIKPLLKNMLDVDAPDHARLKSLVSKAFTPRRIEEITPRIQSICQRHLAKAKQQATFDLIADYALPLPATIVAEMLGVPACDVPKFTKWSNAVISADGSNTRMLLALPKLISFLRYLKKLIKSKRRQPNDDLMTALIEAEQEGDRLDEDELLAMVFLLLVAGFETTVNLIGNGVHSLLLDPHSLEQFRTTPELADTAVEELLRYCGPLELATERFAAEDLQIANSRIPRGSLVFIAISSANRDESQFDSADKINLLRKPNPHLSFGFGPHYCLGSYLARVEAKIAFQMLFEETRQFAFSTDPRELKWRRGVVPRGLAKLPLNVTWN